MNSELIKVNTDASSLDKLKTKKKKGKVCLNKLIPHLQVFPAH